MNDYIYSRYADLPTHIKAFTVKDKDGFYTIVLNQNLSFEQQEKSYAHEMEHINNGDFDSLLNADKLESIHH